MSVKTIISKLTFFLAISSTTCLFAFTNSGYFASWRPNLDYPQYKKLTYVYYSFIELANNTGALSSFNGTLLQGLVQKGHADGSKICIAAGGWANSGGSAGTKWSEMAANPATRQTFVNNLMKIVNDYNCDGIDIDWEYPTGSSSQPFAVMMKMLADSLHKKPGRVLSAAVIGRGNTGNGVLEEVFGYLDHLNIMSYDHSSTGQHSSWEDAVNDLKYWVTDRRCPKHKAVLGVPFYSKGSGSYRDIVAADPANANKSVTTINGNTAYYNGLDLIEKKAKYVLENAGGMMNWELSQDTKDDATSLVHCMWTILIKDQTNSQQPVYALTTHGQNFSVLDNNLFFSNPLANAMTLQILDMKGRSVYLQGIEQGSQAVRLDRGNVAGGVYFLVVKDNSTTWKNIITIKH